MSFTVYNSEEKRLDPASLILLASTKGSGNIRDNFFISRAQPTVLNGEEFNSFPNGKVKQNWELQTSSSGEYLWVFSKTLGHDPSSFLPDRSQTDQMLKFFEEPTFSGLETLPSSQDSERKLEDPAGGLGFEPISKSHYLIPSPIEFISINSSLGAMELSEVFCMSLCRDIKISELLSSTDPTTVMLKPRDENGNELGYSLPVQSIIDILNSYPNSNWPVESGLNMGNLFRGKLPDELIGQYISQLLILDVPFGKATFEQKYKPEWDTTFSVTTEGFLKIQDGVTSGFPTKGDISARRVTTLRDLGSLVKNDPAYGLYFTAGLISAKAGLSALTNPGNGSAFLDTGGPDFLTSIAAVCRAALRSGWLTKWQNALKIRPEEAAGRLSWYEMASTKPSELQDWVSFFNSDLLNTVKMWTSTQGSTQDSSFLPLLYDEGSPTHPAYPAGHACVAGACCTIIKAFIKTHESNGDKILWSSVFGPIQKVDETGNLVDTVDSNETIVGEINKLCSNVSIGRNIAGVHYRSDADAGILMGETVAISYLLAMTKSYYPSMLTDHIEFILEKFNGDLVVIKDGKVFPHVTS